MSNIKRGIQQIANHVFTSNNTYNWYDQMWENRNGYNLPERVEQRVRDIEEASRFFNENWERVERVKSWLADEKSKTIYENLIRFTMTGDRKYHHGLDPNQYFPSDVIRLDNNEVFIDCGGYIADTTLEFIKRSKKWGGYKRIVLFEPDPLLTSIIENNISGNHDVCFIQKGVYSSTEILRFQSDGSSGGMVIKDKSIESKNTVEISVTRIDDVLECKDATYIKMDLEGAEWEALHGASETILRQKPKLGICIYHSNEDRIRLIEYIHELIPDYKLFVRQHSKMGNETVVYAII